MLETLSSPLADVVTSSFAVFPSDPGAPAGQSGISAGRSAAASERGRNRAAKSGAVTFMECRLKPDEAGGAPLRQPRPMVVLPAETQADPHLPLAECARHL